MVDRLLQVEHRPKVRVRGADVGGLIAFARQVEPVIARDLLDKSLRARVDPALDPFIAKYASFGPELTVGGRDYPFTLGRDLVAMAVTVLYERAENHAQAALAVDQLTSSPLHRVVQLELALQLDNYQRVLVMTNALNNHGELDAMALVLRAVALREVGDTDAALTAFTAARLTAAQAPAAAPPGKPQVSTPLRYCRTRSSPQRCPARCAPR